MCMSDMGTIQNQIFQEIEKLQDKVIRIINFLPKGASVKEAYSSVLHKKLHITPKCTTGEGRI